MLLILGEMGERRSGEGRKSGIVGRCSSRKGGREVLGLVVEARGGSWRVFGQVRNLGVLRGSWWTGSERESGRAGIR